jgi:hypothetical protein
MCTSLVKVGPGRGGGEYRFQLSLIGQVGTYEPPVIDGLYFEGIGRYYRPWLEARYANRLSSKAGELDLGGSQEEEDLFRALCGVLQPGSHIMVPYRTHTITAQALMYQVPPAASPLGYLMYLGGCRWYKDWYFAEGFMEGEEKLQATKPLNADLFKEKTANIKSEIKEYLAQRPDPSKMEMETICRGLARRILETEEA